MVIMIEKILKPKVSIIIPCYNRQQYISETVNSALNQTYANFEVITIDDGCTDRTRNILNSYGDHIKILQHPKRLNKGQSASINIGLRFSQSEYVAILDSDDLLEPNKTELQVKYLDENDDIGYVYSNGYEIDEHGQILGKLFSDEYVALGDPENVLLKCPLGCPSGYMVRRSLYEKAGFFNETLRSAQDHDMVIRFAELSKLGYMKEALWYKREHAASLSQFQTERRWRAGFTILDNACQRYPYSFSLRRKRLAVLHFRLAQCILDKRNFLHAGVHFILAGILDPLRAIGVLFGKESIEGYN
jgi:glycosyltransferase involved in cell wall biosynthesis